MDQRVITSVGIDLGTSTTKWIVSELTLTRTSGPFALPRYEITARSIKYAGPIYNTPLLGDHDIDMLGVVEILHKEYAASGISADQIESGAVIVTGETANKRNAERILQELALQAGEFVAAAAGADLESLLAGKGSGAEAYSRHARTTIMNVDVGGGTANAVVFKNGSVAGTRTLHVGGRLLRVSPSGEILYVAPPILKWLRHDPEWSVLRPGSICDLTKLRQFARKLAVAMYAALLSATEDRPFCEPEPLRAANPQASQTVRSHPLLVSESHAVLPAAGEIWISGGVGRLMHTPPVESLIEAVRYGDIGPLLAEALAELASELGYPVRAAEETGRATVIGAGTQTTEISGATLYYDKAILPLRNLPVLQWDLEQTLRTWRASARDVQQEDFIRSESVRLERHMRETVVLYGREGDPPFALVLTEPDYCTYTETQGLAQMIISAYAIAATEAGKLAIVCQGDMGKSLGQAIAKQQRQCGRRASEAAKETNQQPSGFDVGEGSRRAHSDLKVIIVDQVQVREGDYIDIGKPLQDDMVPVVIKTLVFHHQEEGME